MAFLSKKYNLYLAGGDISFSEVFGVDITIWGKKEREVSIQKDRICWRSNLCNRRYWTVSGRALCIENGYSTWV